MGFGKKSKAAAPATTETEVTSAPDVSKSDGDADNGRPGTRQVKRYETGGRRRASIMEDTGNDNTAPGTESGGDDPMAGSRRKAAGGRRSAAMLG